VFKIIRYAALVFLCAVAFGVVGAQEDEKVTVNANLVSVNVSVTDSHGRYVRGLSGGQFELFDDGMKQRVAHFSADDAPFSLGVVYDMHPTTREHAAAVLGALKQFVGALRREDDFFLLVFDERGSATVGFVPTAEQIGGHLAYVPPREPNSLYDAVYLAAEELRSRPRAKRALLVISDGIDHGSRHGYGELRRKVAEFDVQLYGISTTGRDGGARAGAGRWAYEELTRRVGGRSPSGAAEDSYGRAVLEEMARASGGASYSPLTESEGELSDIFARVALEVRRQYTVGFYPAAATGYARRHKILVRVKQSDGAGRLRLSYRESYRPRT
jgi:Ca-activated chloride channel family protein